jgi:type I restriction enzyme S subunit
MSKLERLMQELCPEGVPSRAIQDLFQYEQPTPYLVVTTDYVESGTPVLTAGQTFVLGYTNEAEGIYDASEQNPVIIFDDFTTAFKWVDFHFKAKSSAMKMIRARSGSKVELRYLFYWMGDYDFKPGEHARQWISLYSKLEIPWPPLEVQKEIVSILDKFTQLEAELEAELEARKTHYEVTRDRLLNFSSDLQSHPLSPLIQELCPDGVAVIELGNLVEFRKGEHLKDSEFQDGEFPVVTASRTENRSHAFSNVAAQAVTITSHGAYAGYVNFWESPIWLAGNVFHLEIKGKQAEPRFLFYLLKNAESDIRSRARGGGIPYMNASDLLGLPVQLPPIPIQKEIVSILDKLDALCSDITIGLPAEIAARRKQYEYYRNKLLTFKELDAA